MTVHSAGTEVRPAVTVGSIFRLLPTIAEEIDRGEHATTYGVLRHHLPSVRDLLAESRARRIDEELPGYTYALTAMRSTTDRATTATRDWSSTSARRNGTDSAAPLPSLSTGPAPPAKGRPGRKNASGIIRESPR